jgi:hypothetical protein
MQTFIKNPKKGGRPEAEGDMLDDGVVAFSIAGQVMKEYPFTPQKNYNILDKVKKTGATSKRTANAGFRF